MIIYSPHLNSSPNDLAFALEPNGLKPRPGASQFAELLTLVDGVPVHTTGTLEIDFLKNHHSEVRVPYRPGMRVEQILRVTRIKRSKPFWVNVPVQVSQSSPQGNTLVLPISGSSVQVSRAMQSARSRVSKLTKLPRSYTPIARSTSLRPSPEIVNRQFLKITEVGNAGTLQPAQSGREVVPVLAYYRTWSGTRTPGFGTKKARQLPVNPHAVEIIEVFEDRFSVYAVNTFTNDHSYELRPFSEVYGAPGTFLDTSCEDKASFQALQKLISGAQLGIQSNLAQNLAQVSQLSSLIVGNSTAILKSLRQLKRGNIPGAMSALSSGRAKSKMPGMTPPSAKKSLASQWLQLQYGWKPLLHDIEGLLKILPNLTSPGGFVQRVTSHASASAEVTDSTYPPGDSSTGGNPGKTNVLQRTSVKYVLRYRLDDPAAQFIAQTGFSNPINLAWEVLPFSFVADWFLPIGSYLETLTAFQGLTFLSGSRTVFTRIRANSVISYGGHVVGVPQTLVTKNASYAKERILLGRQSLSAFPTSTAPSFNLNPFANSGLAQGTNSRAQNAIALLTQAFK
jgi:hypothetical protein